MTARFGKKAKWLNRSNSPRTWLWSYVIRHIAMGLTFNHFKPHLKIACKLYIKATVICYMARDQGLGLSPGPVAAQTLPICKFKYNVYHLHIKKRMVARWLETPCQVVPLPRGHGVDSCQ